jgi:predicted transcriptional regulator
MNMKGQLIQIRLFRLTAGMKQVDLAERSGVSQPRISKIETGQINPTPEEKKKLS